MLMLAAHHLDFGGIHRIEGEGAEQVDLHLRDATTFSATKRALPFHVYTFPAGNSPRAGLLADSPLYWNEPALPRAASCCTPKLLPKLRGSVRELFCSGQATQRLKGIASIVFRARLAPTECC